MICYNSASQAAGTLSANARFHYVSYQQTAGGMGLTNQLTQSGLAVSVPSYTQYKFQSTEPGAVTAPSLSGTDAHDGASLEMIDLLFTCDGSNTGQTKSNTRIHKFNSVGTDFNVFFFLNVPVWYRLTSTPAAN